MPNIHEVAPDAPRSSYSVSDLLDRVRGDLAWRGLPYVTDNDIIRWAMEAQDKIATATHWFRTQSFIDSVSGVAEYTVPYRAIAIEEVRFNQLAMANTSVHQLAQVNYMWRRVGTGTPTRWYGRGSSSFGLFVTPGQSAPGSGNIEVTYTALPPVVSAPEDSFFIPYGFDYLLAVHCKLRGSEKDAAGEGGRRIPGLALEWQQGLELCKREVSSFAEGDVWSMGEDALYNQLAPWRSLWSIQQYATISRP